MLSYSSHERLSPRQILLKILPHARERDAPLPADLNGREFSVCDHFADLLAGGLELRGGLFDRQDLAYVMGVALPELLRQARQKT